MISVGLAAVRFATPADLPTIRIQEIDGSVLRGAVLNMIRKGRIILPQNARDGLLPDICAGCSSALRLHPGWGIGSTGSSRTELGLMGLGACC